MMKYSELKGQLLHGINEKPHDFDFASMAIRLNNHREEHFDKLLEALESMLNNANTMPASICVPAANALNAAQTVKEQK